MRKVFLIVFLFCGGVFAADASNKDKEFVVFVGNPGVGKSTMINSIVGSNVAISGLSAGVGLTTSMQRYEHKGTTYIDTPGLADARIKKQAAREIEKAFLEPGQYRVFFLIVLQAGRVRPEDVTTINQVMDAIVAPDKAFNVIFNMVSPKERRLLFDSEANFDIIKSEINKGRNKTASFHVIDLDKNVDDEMSEYINIGEELAYFLHAAGKSFFQGPYGINRIDIRDLEELKRQHELERVEALKKLSEQKQKADELERQMAQIRADEAERVRQQKQEQDRQHRLRQEWQRREQMRYLIEQQQQILRQMRSK